MKGDSIHSNFLFQSIALLLLLFIIPLQLTLQNSLMQLSSDLIVHLQDTRTDGGINFFSIVKYINDIFLFCVVVPLVINFFEPVRTSKIILFLCSSYFLSNLLSLIFQEYRPF